MARQSLLGKTSRVIVVIFVLMVLAIDVSINSYAYWLMKNIIQPSLPIVDSTDASRQYRRSSRILLFFLANALLAGCALLWIIYLLLCKLLKVNTSHMTRQDEDSGSRQCCKNMGLATAVALHITLAAFSLHYILGWEQDTSTRDTGERDLRGTYRCLAAIIEFDLVVSGIQLIVLGLLLVFMLCGQLIKHRVRGAAHSRTRAHNGDQEFEL
ncbi:hypothetical protein PFICI_10040 [Pestalotiopsis fici W106-1]|uniref:Uncharacterized protein n=1 Tax=Pestalotiopsis fici (strain W106-1 / CGMCC3.15140) TaxID=1229662 RepID=W3WVS9_PESFW|nr:uncharacterized protein PFICI_10040 [Pestalotiopsis fici W106-1]ETS77978.1 hypothetical protein PFICI_10040 [Pestalotiopsis fici W106-1]